MKLSGNKDDVELRQTQRKEYKKDTFLAKNLVGNNTLANGAMTN